MSPCRCRWPIIGLCAAATAAVLAEHRLKTFTCSLQALVMALGPVVQQDQGFTEQTPVNRFVEVRLSQASDEGVCIVEVPHLLREKTR